MTSIDNRLTDIGNRILKNKIDASEADENNSDLTYIASGEGRSVFRLDSDHYSGKVVVKFAKSKDRYRGGVDQNQYESFIWNESTQEERKVLAPTVDSHKRGLWLVMKYAKPVPEGYDLEPIRDELYDLFGNRIDTTFRRRNFGIINGKIKLIDYGYSMKT